MSTSQLIFTFAESFFLFLFLCFAFLRVWHAYREHYLRIIRLFSEYLFTLQTTVCVSRMDILQFSSFNTDNIKHNVNFSLKCILHSNLPLMLMHEFCYVGWPCFTGMSFPSFVSRHTSVILYLFLGFIHYVLLHAQMSIIYVICWSTK